MQKCIKYSKYHIRYNLESETNLCLHSTALVVLTKICIYINIRSND